MLCLLFVHDAAYLNRDTFVSSAKTAAQQPDKSRRRHQKKQKTGLRPACKEKEYSKQNDQNTAHLLKSGPESEQNSLQDKNNQ